jgi:hypothetical protein
VSVLRRTPEVALRDKVCHDALWQLGVRSLQLNLHFDAGWPDRIFLIPGGLPLFMEFKRPGYVPRPLQYQRLETLVQLGYLESVDHGWTDSYTTAMERIRLALARAGGHS